jgi:type I restriction-modification system DNA methylase subunit
MTRQTGKEAVHKLVDDFDKNKSQYMSKSFQETEARNLFIDPFFTALGWDFQQTGIDKKFWDVHLEARQRVNSTTKKPDYVFRVKEGAKYREKFFVEAKAPHVDLTGKNPVFQAKRYAFSSHGKTPIVVLTDFQTFRVFNGLEKPIFENPDRGLIKYLDLEYHTYLDTWDAIWDAFSKEAVTEGSIEQLTGKVSRNVKSLDDEFLADISAWRETLARNVALRNKDLSVAHINEAVQRILDRLIFIRNLEDREIESENGLLSMLNVKENIYPHLIPLFKNLDSEYNGLLFKEHFSEKITIDDPTIKSIIKQLYPPQSPYAFDMIEPEILGRIYERFLGSKIRLTENHQAKVEEKPEVRHAGGVYYTPEYIVDYIVENTVGVKIKDKSPQEIEAIKICDPACGSGSFLLGAFHYLIEYHREWYTGASQTAQKKYRDDFFTNAENEIQLTLKKKTEILKNNIFGVDIDREATEVAIMSLYLKILDEGYDKGQAELFLRGHILPDMTGNIKCGNSLIGMDFYVQGALDLSDDEQVKVNCFDWEKEFDQLITRMNTNNEEYFTTNQHEQDKGLFDVVVGNPPWVSLTGKFGNDILTKHEIDYLQRVYKLANTYMPNLYEYFLYKVLSLLKGTGLFGYIIPDRLASNSQFINLRKEILAQTSIKKLVFRAPFPNITADTLIIIYRRGYDANNKVEISEYNQNAILIDQNEFEQNDSFSFVANTNKQVSILLKKIDTLLNIVRLASLYSSTSGFGGKSDVITTEKNSSKQIPVLKGASINRYKILQNYWFEFKKQNITGRTTDKEKLGYKPKILIRKTGDSIIAMIEKTGMFPEQSLYFLYDPLTDLSPEYILGILNSKIISFYFREKLITNKNSIAQIKKIDLDKLPIPTLDLSQKPDKTKHDVLVSLVEKMLDLKQKEVAEKSDHQKTVITRQIDAVDKAIDAVVYELYGLMEEEIKVIEEEE